MLELRDLPECLAQQEQQVPVGNQVLLDKEAMMDSKEPPVLPDLVVQRGVRVSLDLKGQRELQVQQV
jgi:hypothetical protein